ncbi:helix-turn-helix transcriptional regulator [Lactococcus petauri]|uniref:helix-turn-helix transcriptional regulator n=1 Tax=Lactococcus petauri TaxID=1940789 RepID=UPI0022E709BD|nr:helix-turn-helix transcriptional regulator [Lactococcus petauri]
MKLTTRQTEIINIVKAEQPISGEKIAQTLGLSRATLRNDLSILTMTGLLDAKPKVGYFYTGQKMQTLYIESCYSKKVADFMTSPLIVAQDMSVYDAATSLFLYDIGSIYVKNENGDLAGLLSRKDLLRFAISGNNLEKTPVAVIMTRMPNIHTITADKTLLEAGNILSRYEVDSLPVLEKTDSKKIIGKISIKHIMKAFIQTGNEMQSED